MASDRSTRRIERLLDEADEAAVRLDWETVRARATAVFAFDPENSDAQELLDAADRAVGDEADHSEQGPPAGPVAASDSPLTSQPTSFADGRYVVKRFLGEGGKKKVYLAHDELLDRDVAFALIKTEGLDDISRERITREARQWGASALILTSSPCSTLVSIRQPLRGRSLTWSRS